MPKKDKQKVNRAQVNQEGKREYTRAEIAANIARLRKEEAHFLSRLDECEVRMISLLIESRVVSIAQSSLLCVLRRMRETVFYR